MKIGIIDNRFYALQGLLAEEGHEVLVYVSDYYAEGDFNPTHYTDQYLEGSVRCVRTIKDLGDCDFVLGGDSFNRGSTSYFKQMFPSVPCMYYSSDILIMEDDRTLTHAMLNQYSIPATYGNLQFRLPKMLELSSPDEFDDLHTQMPNGFVIKRNAYSSNNVSSEIRTVIVRTPEQYQLPESNAWFDTEGVGGCNVEEYIDGPEMCFGMWFDGKHFIGQLYHGMEHKGAQNHDRGDVLTGEVGTVNHFVNAVNASNVLNIFKAMEPLFEGKLVGMVDFNTKLTVENGKTTLNFLEFTLRFGRPTLELQLAHWKLNCGGVGPVFANLLGFKGKGATTESYVVSVTAFGYGLPLLTAIGNKYPDIDFSDFSFSKNLRIPETDMQTNEDGMIMPLFMQFDRNDDCYVIRGEERYAAFIGVSDSMNEAQAIAYNLTKDIRWTGVTWRDDVGNTFKSAEDMLHV